MLVDPEEKGVAFVVVTDEDSVVVKELRFTASSSIFKHSACRN